jgi:hypothetical protein
MIHSLATHLLAVLVIQVQGVVVHLHSQTEFKSEQRWWMKLREGNASLKWAESERGDKGTNS